MKFISRIALTVAAGASLTPFPAALAADYNPPIFVEEAAEYVPVEVGSGWYLRGDVGYAFSHPFEHQERSTGLTSSFNEEASLFTGSVGMGYHFNDFLRGELNFGILPSNEVGESDLLVDGCAGTTNTLVIVDGEPVIVPVAATSDCESSNYGTNEGYSLMANAYVDLGTYVGITPYIGGGVGLAYNKYFRSLGERDCNDEPAAPSGAGGFDCNDPAGYEGSVDSEGQYNLAYSVGAGFAYRLSQNVSIDLGYEYSAVPDAEYVAYNDGAFDIEKGIDYHQIKVGLRYDLW